jgi:hypothetical protein
MAETYQIITNPDALREFIAWLPDCLENEQYYCCLFMRKKYCKDVPWIKSDKGQLKRFTSKKEFLYDKIAQLECKVGAFTFDGNPVPQESLALYISPNPRDLWKATVRSIGQLAKVLECNGRNSNPHAEVMSEIQKNAGTRKYVMFDIDDKEQKLVDQVVEITEGYCDITETRGGYHIFVHKSKIPLITEKMWYNKIAAFSDVTGDAMTCPAGTYQGGHTVKFIHRCKDDERYTKQDS